MSPAELLLKAADLIESPSRWTRLTMARSRHGEQVCPQDADACRWCAVGAIEKLAPDRDTYIAAMQLAVFGGSTQLLTGMNDKRGMTAKRMASLLRKAAS